MGLNETAHEILVNAQNFLLYNAHADVYSVTRTKPSSKHHILVYLLCPVG